MNIMHTVFRGGFAALIGLTFLATPLVAKRIAIPPLPDRIIKADAIIIGKITSVENKPVKAPGGGELGLGVLKVEDGLLGGKGLTHVKVAFFPGQLESGQEACFLLTKVPGENYYLASGFLSMLRKTDPSFDAQVAVIKRSAALLEDPVKGLKAKNANDRFLTAALLLGKYRPWDRGAEKQADIDATQSKLILEAIAEADWNKLDPTLRLNGQQLFYRLGVTDRDGWVQPMNFQEVEAAAKQWLKANAGKYRVKRFVFGEEKK
jgi:hypothetical protein